VRRILCMRTLLNIERIAEYSTRENTYELVIACFRWPPAHMHADVRRIDGKLAYAATPPQK